MSWECLECGAFPAVGPQTCGLRFHGIREAIVFNDSALKVEDGIFYAPVYMIMFLKKETFPEKMIYTIGSPLEIKKN